MTSQFADMTSLSNFYVVVMFFLSSLVSGPSFLSISLLVLELWLLRIDQKSRNWIYPCLSYWMLPVLHLLTFLSYQGRTNREWVVKSLHPTLPNLTQIWVKDLMTNNFWNPTPSLIVGLGRTMTNFIHSYKFYYHKFIYLES